MLCYQVVSFGELIVTRVPRLPTKKISGDNLRTHRIVLGCQGSQLYPGGTITEGFTLFSTCDDAHVDMNCLIKKGETMEVLEVVLFR